MSKFANCGTVRGRPCPACGAAGLPDWIAHWGENAPGVAHEIWSATLSALEAQWLASERIAEQTGREFSSDDYPLWAASIMGILAAGTGMDFDHLNAEYDALVIPAAKEAKADREREQNAGGEQP